MSKLKELNSSKIEKQLKQLFDDFFENDSSFIKDEISLDEKNYVEKISRILDLLDLGREGKSLKGLDKIPFNFYSGDELVSARERLARYSENLGDFITEHEKKSDFAYIWRKGAYAADWLPMKDQLTAFIPKITNPEVESELTKKYIKEQYYTMFHRRRADYLIRKMEAIDRMIRTIDHRLWELRRQYQNSKDSQI